MATNAIGLNLLLQASTQQVQDLLQGLQPGAALRGRVVDVLPQDKAVLNLAGQNLIAQLPLNAAVQKGDILSLLVTQSAAPAAGQSGTGPAAPALTLRLVSIGDQAVSAGQAPAPSAAGQAAVQLPPQAVIEQALTLAHLPVNNATLAVAQTLASHGLPLDAQTLQTVVQQAESLLGLEQVSSQSAAAQSAPALSPQDRSSLQEALPALRFALQNTTASEPRLQIQQALNLVSQALEEPVLAAPALPLPASTNVAIPIGPQTPVPAQTSSASTATAPVIPATNAPSVPAADVLPPPGGAAGVLPAAGGPPPSLQASLQSVLDQPNPVNVLALQTALNELHDVPAAPAPQQQLPLLPQQASASPALEALPVRRETAVLLLQAVVSNDLSDQSSDFAPTPLQFQNPVQAAQVLQAAQTLNTALSQPQSPEAQVLVRSVQAQFPQSPAPQILQEARSALQEVAAHFEALPPSRTVAGPPALANELEAAGLPAPGPALSQFPRQTVFEAVAWLAARDLPPQRPLVQAAAQFLDQGLPALDLAHQAAGAKATLPEGILQWRPSLAQAFTSLDQALQRSTLNLDGPDLASQLMQWPQTSGMNMEKNLLAAFQAPLPAAEPGPSTGQAAGAAANSKASVPSLREALANVQESLKQALRDPAGAAPSVAPKLQQALADTSRALQSLSALPLQTQATPSFQSVTLPLALPLQGPLQNGLLTVSWRQGQDKTLDEKDPVNVGVVLNTEALGEVRVMLQVWKGHANAVVKAQDAATAAFLAEGAAELKQGFAERTPFQLQSLDFAVAQAADRVPGIEAPLPPSGSLNLSA